MVKAINSAEHDDLNWSSTTYHIQVEGSLADLASKAGVDLAGNEKAVLPVFLGNCVTLESASDDVHDRVMSNKMLPDATHEALLSDPALLADHRDVVKRVVVSGHSKFPGTIELALHNIQGSAQRVQYTGSESRPTQSLVIRAQAGERIEGRTVLRNDLTADDIRHLQYYPDATEKNLDSGVAETRGMDGRPSVLVAHSPEKPHIVVDEIRRHWKNDERCTSDMHKYMKSNQNKLPLEVLRVSADNEGYVIIPKEIFEDYKKRCSSTLKKSRPLSDVAHPYGGISRVISESHFRTEKSGSRVASAMESERKLYWTHPSGTSVGHVTEQAKQHVINKVHSAWFRVKVFHAPIDAVAKAEVS